MKMILFAAATAALTRSAVAATTIYTTGFDTADGAEGWPVNDAWKVEEGAGVNGSKALVWINEDTKRYDVCSFPIPEAKAWCSYRATFKVKPYDLKGSIGCTICWTRGSTWLGGAGGTTVKWGDKSLKPDSDGWYTLNIRTTPYLPASMEKCLLQLYVNSGGTGRVAFDDIRVDFVDEKTAGKVSCLTTSCYRNTAADGDVRILACTEIPRENWPAGKTIAEISYQSIEGDRKIASMSAPNPDWVETTMPVSAFAFGRHPVVVTVRGDDGRVFGSDTVEFERVRQLPRRRVRFDRFHRTMVDGKLFYPLGMYWSRNTLAKTNALERFAAGPFNCLFNYEATMTSAEMDRYWAKGLRVIVGMTEMYPPLNGKRAAWGTPDDVKTDEDAERYVRRLVEGIKDHPALLAWCACDEMPEDYQSRLEKRHELLRELDPEHPVFIDLCNPPSARVFLKGYDVVGSDPYPVGFPPTHRRNAALREPGKSDVWTAGDSAASIVQYSFGMRPVWQVPQAFSWEWDCRGKYETWMRFPSEMQMRSMVWQQIAEGANGILLYSYGQLLNNAKETEFPEYWNRSCRVASEVRDRIPMLLLKPGLPVARIPKRVRVRTWRDGDSAYVLICNTHPEMRKGNVVIDGAWKTSELVFGNGVKLENGRLSLDMNPIEVAIIRLK